MSANNNTSSMDFPVVSNPDQFDKKSGSLTERLVFNNRPLILLISLLLTVVLGAYLTQLQPNGSFERMIPTSHPYIANFLKYQKQLRGLGNSVYVVVESKSKNIYSAEYLNVVREINDELILMPGVERAYLKSLWTPATRWTTVTEMGLEGGPVIPDWYDGSPKAVAQVQQNVSRSSEVGQLVAENFESSVIYVPLAQTSEDGKALDYRELNRGLESIRERYSSDIAQVRIIGFAKLIGDLIDGLIKVAVCFLIAVVIVSAMVYWFNRSILGTSLVVVCSIIAVVWQLGALAVLGYGLDPYSMLVPFLTFAIGVSHGTQKLNSIVQDVASGSHQLVAARYTFRRLFVPGLTALLSDAAGFGVLALIDIDVVQDLAITASIGVGFLIFTNLILIPVLLSYVGISQNAIENRKQIVKREDSESKNVAMEILASFTGTKVAAITILVAAGAAVWGLSASKNLQIGDLDAGAPELRSDSRYNLDNAYFVSNYAASSDILAALFKTPPNRCVHYETQMKMDALQLQLRQYPGVESNFSLADLSRLLMMGLNEGDPAWFDMVPNPSVLGAILMNAPRELSNVDCSLLPMFVFLSDHKAETLEEVTQIIEDFDEANRSENFEVLLGAGNAGIAAATNEVVKDAMNAMLYWVYAAVILISYLTFRSVRAVVIAVLPLMLTSVLCEALMVYLGIGVKVATLPVVALGVGIGIDYALYVLSVIQIQMKQGDSLKLAYSLALQRTGKVVLLTGMTLTAAVATWGFSPIKYQADMGVLLAFMFFWNMVGALILMPALARFVMKEKQATAA